MDKELIYTVTKIEPAGLYDVLFVIEIIDEYTLQVLEARYPGQLTFDGGRTFTLKLVTPVKGLSDNTPKMWKQLAKTHPDFVSKFVLERLRGNV